MASQWELMRQKFRKHRLAWPCIPGCCRRSVLSLRYWAFNFLGDGLRDTAELCR
jgi:hypothetical protein